MHAMSRQATRPRPSRSVDARARSRRATATGKRTVAASISDALAPLSGTRRNCSMATRERPLSPHMQVYRWQITMVMSLLHRVTGLALTAGAFGLAWWLVMLAAGPEAAGRAMDIVSSPIGLVFLFAFSLALVYHLLNGL